VTNDDKFQAIYKKAMTVYAQQAFKLDKEYPLTCSTFAGFFLYRKLFPTVETLARKAIEMTDINAVASDGWYLLARKEHYAGNEAKASDYYNRSDQARGGMDKGYLPAKFGAVQMQISLQDFDGAKFRLEKIIQQTKNPEAMMLLGALYAQEVINSQTSGLKEDKSTETKKALNLFETVRALWKDEKKNLSPDESILIYLSRLYEMTNPEKAMQCLRQVEEMQLEAIPDSLRPEGLDDEAALPLLREHLTPQLLNNMGCFLYQAENTVEAREMFQTALNACVKLGEREEGVDTDALVTTISYNLARTYEAAGLLDEAKGVYEGLLARHSDYTDARARLTYIALLQSPHDEGQKAMAELYKTDWENLEVRALFGWYLSKAKKRVSNIAEDQEQRHYKHTLQNHDKHDRYSLTGMGNLHMMTAREMKRDTDQEKEKRRKMYERAVEFFDKAIQLDPQNAYAAQGIGIALAEDKREFSAALQVFTKVRDTMKEANVHVNLGHVYAELRNWSRAIENVSSHLPNRFQTRKLTRQYDLAISKSRTQDPQILACLGRVWLMKGKSEMSIPAMQTALDCAQRALSLAPEQVHLEFNVAFVQMQIAQLIYTLPESRRHLDEVKDAAKGLDDAIETFTRISTNKNSPYGRGNLEQRAAMGKNTMRRQLERSVQAQKEYEEKNAEKLRQARETREAEFRKREEIRLQKEEVEREEKRKLAEERRIMLEEVQRIADKRAEEERAREEAEFTTDSETGNKVKRRKKAAERKRKKKGEDDDVEGESRGVSRSGTASVIGAEDGEERPRQKKKRKLERKTVAAKQSKYKSSEIVVESDSDAEGGARANGDKIDEDEDEDMQSPRRAMEDDDEEEELVQRSGRRKKVARIIADDDDDEDEGGGGLFGEDDGSVTGKAVAKNVDVDEDGDSRMSEPAGVDEDDE
jgi:RNA polymerase-associated protein CTR9